MKRAFRPVNKDKSRLRITKAPKTASGRIGLAFLLSCLLAPALTLLPGEARAMKGYLNDVIATFSDTSRFDVCGDCHSTWTGGRARGDMAVNYKLWDYSGNSGMSDALRRIDVFGVGVSNEWKVANDTSDVPFPFTGAADKDGDGYINLVYRTERAGMPINHNAICSTCTGAKGGGNSGGLATPPAGWDMDDNDGSNNPATGLPMGAVPWDWTQVGNQANLATYYSTDAVPPNTIDDLVVDIAWIDANNGGVMPSDSIPLTWTAPADDDPSDPGAVQTTTPVHHYDLRFTTQLILDNYNANFVGRTPPKLCSPDAETNGDNACQPRNHIHWHTMYHISDCGVNNGSGQEHLMHLGVMDAANANACASGVIGWNRGEAAPLMRALYESGFEDEALNLGTGNYVTGPPFAPKTPGSTENYVLTEVTNKHAFATSGQFNYTDPHDGATNTQPNYIAPDTVYWLAIAADDGVVRPCVETPGNELVIDPTTHECRPPQGAETTDGVIWDGPFVEGANSGQGFHSYADPGFADTGDIIAVKTGGGANGGAAITSVSPNLFDADAAGPYDLTLTGIGFTANAEYVALVDAAGTPQACVSVTGGNVTVTDDRNLTASFSDALVDPLSGEFTVDVRENAVDCASAPMATAWVDAVTVQSTAPGTIRLTSATYSVNEGAGTIAIFAERVGGNFGNAAVDYATSNGTAVAGSDYTTTSGSLSWLDGEGGSKSFVVPITDDLDIESDETFTVTLTNVTGSSNPTLGSPSSGTVTIVDNEANPGQVGFDTTSYTVNEPDGTVTLNVQRTGGSDGAVSIDYTTIDGDALAGSDYTANSGTLIWADQDSASKQITVTITNDTSQEGSEFFNVDLINGTETGGVSINTGSDPATVTIVDDDTPPTLEFSAATYAQSEDGVTATITVTRTGSSIGAVDVDYATSDGTAVNGGGAGLGDYDAASGTLSWADAETASKTFTVTINDDVTDEADETINLTLSNPTNGAIVGTQGTATLSLTDNDSSLQFNTTGYTVNEDGLSATITVTRTDITNAFPGAVTADYATADNTAVTTEADNTNGLRDYEPAANTLSWADGDSADKTFTVTVNDDTVLEGDEVVDLSLSNATGNVSLGSPNTATLTIIDDETPGTLQFNSATYSEREDGGVNATITVTRVGGGAGALTVDYATSDGTAVTTEADNTNGLRDYEPASGTLSWADGDTASKSFTVVINNDSVDEADETVNLTLSNPMVDGSPDGSILGTPNTATLTIVDSYGALQFDASAYSVDEDGGVSAVITVTRAGGTNQAVSVDYATADGTATAPTDYGAASGTLSWIDGEGGSKTFSISIINDSNAEDPDETVDLSLSNTQVNAVPDPSILGTPNTATLTIVDSHGTLQFSNASYSVNEDGGVDATITVTRTGGTNGAVSVDYATADNTATAGSDYTAASGTLNWVDGDGTSKSFTVAIANDSLDENPDEIVDLSLTNARLNGASDASVMGAQDTATLTIIDSFGTLQFDSATYSVNEDGGVAATITVTRTGGTNGAVSVDYATADNTATAGSDYTAASGTLNWADGETASKTFTVTILNDAVDEDPDEILDLNLSNPVGGAQLGAQSTATLTIIDSYGTLQLSSATYSVSEDGGAAATITVTRTGGTNQAMSVDYATADGTATAGSDYTAASGTLSWIDGEGVSKTFTIPVINDTVIEAGGETVSIALSNSQLNATPDASILGSPGNGTLTITDSVGRVQFVGAPYSSAEDTAGSFVVTAQRIEGSGGQFDVPYATSDGSATTADSDYAAASGTLSWADGETGNKTFTVTVNSDRNIESDESLNLDLSPPAQSPVSTTLTLTNDDFAGTLEFSATSYNVDENVGGGVATITVTRTGGDVGAVSVDYASSDGTALAGSDYTAVSGTLNWADTDTASKTFNVPITDDLDIEGGEDLTLTLSNAVGTGVSIGANNPATLNIIDDDSSGTVQFSSPTFTVREDGGVDAAIDVTRTGGNAGTITIDYASSDGTAVAGSDYTAVSGTLTWNPGDTSTHTVNIPITDDTLDEDPDETVNIALSNPTLDTVSDPSVLGAQSTATLTIVDSYGTLQFNSTSYQVTEDGGLDAVITVTRTGGTNQPISVDYTTSDGTATAPDDYTATTGTLSWADGETGSKTFNVPIVNDAVNEIPSEGFDVSLSNTQVNAVADPSILGTPNIASVTIIDSVGSLQFSNTAYSVNEDGGVAATITVTRTGGSNGDVTIDYATSDGTAAAGSDYTAASGTLTWLTGDSASKTFTVPVTDDATDEDPDETVNLTLSNPTLNTLSEPTVLGSPGTATLTIIDSLGTIQFSGATYSVNEDGGVAATITVDRVGGTNGAASIDYATSDGTAVAGSDYTAVSGTLNWADGDGASKTFTVPVINDGLTEDPDETVNLSLGNIAGAWLGAPNTATLTIIDSLGTLQLSSANFSVAEDGTTGVATITVSRVGGSNGAASIDYATSDGSATAPADYAAASGTLNWADGDAGDKTFTVSIVNDSSDESDETVNLSLSNAVGAWLGSPSSGALTIVDSVGSIQFSASSYNIDETGGNLTVTVQRVGGSNGPATVDYATADGSATAGIDYTGRSGTFSWVDGDRTDRTFTIPVVSDAIAEGAETVNLSLANVTGAKAGTPNNATVTIVDGPGTVQFSSANFSVSETNPSVTVTVTRTGGSGGAASVNYATSDGTATAGGGAGLGDYDAVSGTLSWTDSDGAAKTFTIPINSDLLAEGAETVGIALSNASGVTIGTTGSATLTINDAAGNIQFSSATYSVSEDGAGIATITVSRVEGAGGAASVNFATADADPATTATAGDDYTANSGTLSWTDGDSANKTFTVSIANDAVIEEPDEEIKLTLSGVSGAALGAPVAAQLVIVDSAGTLRFSAPSYSQNETGASATITVMRIGGNNGAASVDYLTSDGTATAGSDYTTASGTLNWADGDATSKTFTIPLLDDTTVEGDETVNIDLTGASGASIGTPNTAILTISDDENAGNLEFTSAVYSVNEDGAGLATITVRRSGGSDGVVTADFATSNGTAQAGSDYTAASGTLTWVDGDAADKTFNVDITPDTLIEAGGETINLSLSNPTGGATLDQGATARQTAQLTIVDSAGSLLFSASGYSANEGDGTVTVNVQRINGSGGTVTVDYATSDGTATAGADYTAAGGTLSWPADDNTIKSFNVTLLDEQTIEGDETVGLTLSNPTGGAAVGVPGSATLTIVNDDDTGSVMLAAATYSALENAGVVTVTVSRAGGSVGAVAVYVETAPDSGGANPATAGDDYNALTPTRIDWADGDSADKTVDITINDETNFEQDETFLVNLSNPVNTTLGATTTATVTIQNDDSPTATTLTIDPGWSMISVPTDLLTESNMQNIFYDDMGKGPAIYKWISDGVPGAFSGADSITDTAQPGEGYWILNDRTISIELDDQFNAAQSIDPYEITLQVGGSMIGNPYQVSLDLLVDVRVCNFTATGCSLSTDWVDWSTAAGNGWVTGTIYRYDTNGGNYAMKNPIDGTMIMAPWEGYWIRTETTDVLKMRFYNASTPP